MLSNRRRFYSALIAGSFCLLTGSALFQNCAPVRFATNGNLSQSSLTSLSCDPSTTPPQSYTTGVVGGTCACDATTSVQVCTPTSCVDPQATLVAGSCVGLGVSTLTVRVNGQSSVSLLPSTATVPLAITATGAIQSLNPLQSNISRVAGTCAQSTLSASDLQIPGGALALGQSSIVYSAALANLIAGCTWRITAVADNGQSDHADFLALLCSAGSANPTQPTCSTADGKPGHSVCSSDGLGYQCVPNAPINCTFNGAVVADGTSVTAYTSASVGYAQTCSSQTRTCQAGVLSGTAAYSSCSVTPGASCSFNGQQIPDGGQATGYTSSSVAFGSICQTGVMLCQNGRLIGSAPYATCSVQGNPGCSVNGQSLLNGQSLVVYQASSVAFGSSCQSQTLLCSNGQVSGDGGQGYDTFPTCTVQPPANCNFNGQSVVNGSGVTAWHDTVVAYGSTCTSEYRQCTNGSLSGSYPYTNCTVTPGQSCSYNGQQVASGASVSGYGASSVAYGASCQAAQATCNNGTLSASISPTCVVGAASNCTFNGATVANGASVTGYSSSQVEPGQTCASTSRTCSNGTLSGDTTYQFSSCTVRAPKPCVFQGTTYPDGGSVVAYSQSSVSYGQSCSSVSQTRVCHDGTLSGSAAYPSCAVQPPASCSFAGQSVASGASVTAYNTASGVSCPSETATCNNGSLALDAGYVYASCTVVAPPATPTPIPAPADPVGLCVNTISAYDSACNVNTVGAMLLPGPQSSCVQASEGGGTGHYCRHLFLIDQASAPSNNICVCNGRFTGGVPMVYQWCGASGDGYCPPAVNAANCASEFTRSLPSDLSCVWKQ